MEPGNFRNLVTIQAPTTVQDAAGQPISSWATVARVWADIRTTNGMEAIKADAVASTVQASIRTRWRRDVTSAMRVLDGSTVYQITAVLPDMRKRQYIDLVCKVVT